MRILLFGKNGQIGWELQRSLAPLGAVIALGRESTADLCGDFADLEGLVKTIRLVGPDVIVNAAAYTAVDKAESEPASARRINALAPAVLAEEATKLGAWLVHYSTDYVFDGSGNSPRKEHDLTEPLSVYGHTKLEGEKAVEYCPRHLVFRTSWVYSARGVNFAKTILRLASERERLSVVNDQIGAPTGAELLADVTAHAIRQAILNPSLAGIYHLVAAGESSWYDYARFVIEKARDAGCLMRVAPEQIAAIPTAAYPTPACRPLNSRLDTSKLQAVFRLQLPEWRVGVERMLMEILSK